VAASLDTLRQQAELDAQNDPEVAALATCMRALASLTGDARKRVIEYVTARFDEDE
jgi:hypothetical protein